MALNEEYPFARNDILPSWWTNALQKFLSVQAISGFALSLQDSTHLQVLAGPGDDAAIIAIGGRWRWNEATVTRAHPGGAAGTFDVFVVTKANAIASTPEPGTDNTVYSYELRILAAGLQPAIEPGVVDHFRKVASLLWNGTAIIGLAPLFGPGSNPTHKPGDLKFTHRAVVDLNYVKSEGQELSRTVYKVLWEAMGSPNTGNGTTTFTAPDHRERVAVGAGGTFTVGASGGVASVKLAAAESGVAEHAHDLASGEKAVNLTALGLQTGGTSITLPVEPTNTTTAGVQAGPKAAASSHTNMQPYMVCNAWIRVF